jgi:hypothetical protein
MLAFPPEKGRAQSGFSLLDQVFEDLLQADAKGANGERRPAPQTRLLFIIKASPEACLARISWF